MKTPKLALPLIAVIVSAPIWGQQDATDYFRASMVGKTIDGYLFKESTDIRASAFSDKHSAFIARWTNGEFWHPASDQHDALFADGHLVIGDGETVEGHYFAGFADYDGKQRIALNSQGHVAYVAWYSPSRIAAIAGDGQLGVWVDRHLIATIKLASQAPDVKITDDGLVVITQLDWHLKVVGDELHIPIDPAPKRK